MSIKLLEEAKNIENLDFTDEKEKKHYVYELIQKLEKEEFKLLEKIRDMEDEMADLRLAESKICEYYLSIK